MRAAAEIRDHLVAELNCALPRSGMYGGEIALRILLDHLAFVDGRDEVLATHIAALRERGAFLSCGVTGALLTAPPKASMTE